MVMEALSGATLSGHVVENGAFPPKTVLELARQLCVSLEIVHAADLLHRDIKPDNVFLSNDGRVVLIDFGSARGFAQGQVKRLTRLVTPGYAAPEQYASQAAFGTYTDVYGLAATLYYAVEGQMPPMATDLMLGARLEFQHAGQLQAGLEAGLKVKVDERPQTVRDLLELLERIRVAPRAADVAPVVSNMKMRVQYVLGWRFENDRFRQASREFKYRDILSVHVVSEIVKVNAESDVSPVVFFFGAFVALVACFLQNVALFIVGAIISGIVSRFIGSKRSAQNSVVPKFKVSIETARGQEFLYRFDRQQHAMQLGEMIRTRAGVPLDVQP